MGIFMNDVLLVIPSLEPDLKLVQLVQTLRQKVTTTFPILIINDGSSSDYDFIFNQTLAFENVRIVKHDLNKGKGAALKTAMNQMLNHYPEADFFVTVDSDGQHLAKDIFACIHRARQSPNQVVLGSRYFGKDVPFRSKFGNLLTSKLLALTTGIKIPDTQTGLRVIPRSLIPQCLTVPGERFEYEMNMLVATEKAGFQHVIEPIDTVYIEENASSHFRIVKDSIAIYKVFLRYFFSSVFSFLVDVGVYALLVFFTPNLSYLSILNASVIARVISAIVNYLLNRSFVFKQEGSHSALKYFGLVGVQIILSATIVFILYTILPIGKSVTLKLIVDSALFFFSYHVQKKYIFVDKE
ncbi:MULTISPECIES: bifunctional glycosyltransferase family 2/GtrA family protein [Enterococcus]|uniref:Glycosyltransferase 2-like domain-containing protein n=1 Tax=Enterococcus sulfureus ATCC 49903 TaxID=1140003 RepID=S0KWW8_9ENTE|nr:bifunctional glycosyltransferase family 2/GtrA family protein [Enterococcus sulfureus]EOT49294.1 hypothetical protein OMY_00222 [Enterococcus sulfureus ATCC 49903]EOT87161.1 hypothetical protein I573_00217 [Enterococcus sulfureus ATCC 49903]